MEARDYLLVEMQKDQLSVEAASLVLSKKLCAYHSTQDAHVVLEKLRLTNLVTYCSPTSESGLSLYPFYRLTNMGRAVAKTSYDKSVDEALHLMWLESTAEA